MLQLAKQYGDISDDTATMLKNTFGELPFDLLINQLVNHKKKTT